MAREGASVSIYSGSTQVMSAAFEVGFMSSYALQLDVDSRAIRTYGDFEDKTVKQIGTGLLAGDAYFPNVCKRNQVILGLSRTTGATVPDSDLVSGQTASLEVFDGEYSALYIVYGEGDVANIDVSGNINANSISVNGEDLTATIAELKKAIANLK